MFWGVLPPPLARLPQDIYGRMKLWAALFCIMTTLPMPFHSHRWIVKIGCAKIILYPAFTWPVVQYRAIRAVVARTGLNQIFQRALHRSECRDLTFDLCQVVLCDSSHVGACPATVNPECQQ